MPTEIRLSVLEFRSSSLIYHQTPSVSTKGDFCHDNQQGLRRNSSSCRLEPAEIKFILAGIYKWRVLECQLSNVCTFIQTRKQSFIRQSLSGEENVFNFRFALTAFRLNSHWCRKCTYFVGRYFFRKQINKSDSMEYLRLKVLFSFLPLPFVFLFGVSK